MRLYSFKQLTRKTSIYLLPQESWKRGCRETLLAEIRKDPVWRDAPSSVRSNTAFAQLFNSLFAQRMLKPMIAGVLIFSVISYSSISTAKAARASLPGEALYSVKLGIERAQVGVAFSESKKAELEISFATTRLNEVNEILAQGTEEESGKPNQNANIEQAMKHFNTDLGSVQKRLEKLQIQENSQETVLKISKLVNEKTTELAENLLVIKEKLNEVQDAKELVGATKKAEEQLVFQDASLSKDLAIPSESLGGVATSTSSAHLLDQSASSTAQTVSTSTQEMSSVEKTSKPPLFETLNNALAVVDKANTKSLEMFVENAQTSQSQAVQQDAVSKVQKKIDTIEKAQIQASVDLAASVGAKASVSASSTQQAIIQDEKKGSTKQSEAPQQIKDAIGEAKKILDSKNISELGKVVDKVKEISAIAKDASESAIDVKEQSQDIKEDGSSISATSTPTSLNQKTNTDASVLGATTVKESLKTN
ncbi:hypothetical protein BK004_01185 [bacterium CG10_46_32]|nr:MAG: hypothetical protein BK004_01185 [bacterium CG10_46_32]PIR56312.1 MAG: hypothetical protein COU73_01200 [Parcubacteria group bacterium CG10_big_fil_rev_8_21_14_0_10_46_32]